MVNLTQLHPYADFPEKFDIPGYYMDHVLLSERTSKIIGRVRFGY